MKKLILYILGLMCLVSCEKEEIKEEITMKEQLLGEWVYNHPEEGVWDKLKFIESDIFYYSNVVKGDVNISNDTDDGRYSIYDNNKVEISYTLNGTAQMGQFTVQEIKKYSFTAEFFTGKNESAGVFTYARLLKSYEMERGEKMLPDYASLVQTDIRGFKSHNIHVLTVDNSTGEITAVGPGLSYVDVITEKGTAVIEIKVAGVWPEYIACLGKTMEEVKSLYGAPTYASSSSMYYKLIEHEFFSLIYMWADDKTKKVHTIDLMLKEGYDKQKVLAYLNHLYYPYRKGTSVELDMYSFNDQTTREKSIIGITYFGTSNLIKCIDVTY